MAKKPSTWITGSVKRGKNAACTNEYFFDVTGPDIKAITEIPGRCVLVHGRMSNPHIEDSPNEEHRMVDIWIEMRKESAVNLANEILRVCLDDRSCYLKEDLKISRSKPESTS